MIPMVVGVFPILPATNTEDGPSALPMIDTDVSSLTLRIRFIDAVTIPITIKVIPMIFPMYLISRSLQIFQSVGII